MADRALVRAALLALLGAAPGVTLAGVASGAAEAAAMLARQRPAVVVVDLGAAAGEDHAALVRLGRHAPRAGWVLLGGSARGGASPRAAPARGPGWVRLAREDGPAALLQALAEAAAGAARAGAALVGAWAGLDDPEPAQGPVALTPRERELLTLWARGATVAGAARALGMSAHTARTHRRQLMAKLGAAHTAALVRAALRLGLA